MNRTRTAPSRKVERWDAAPEEARRTFAVRAARASDVDALAQLEADLDALHAKLAPTFFRKPGVAAGFHFLRALSERDALVLVGEDSGRVMGALLARIVDTPADLSLVSTRRLYIESLMVAVPSRRRGIGSRLLAAAERWGRAHGATQVVLTVWDGNEAAETLYARRGYRTLHRVLARNL